MAEPERPHRNARVAAFTVAHAGTAVLDAEWTKGRARSSSGVRCRSIQCASSSGSTLTVDKRFPMERSVYM
jgi:hypothetical protein